MADSPFLEGARRELAMTAPICAAGSDDWVTSDTEAAVLIAATPQRRHTLAPLPDPPSGGGPGARWPPSGYAYHLADLFRGCAERWVLLAQHPGVTFVGPDPDDLAAARNYSALPAEPAPWAVRTAWRDFDATLANLSRETRFHHTEWGEGTVGDTGFAAETALAAYLPALGTSSGGPRWSFVSTDLARGADPAGYAAHLQRAQQTGQLVAGRPACTRPAAGPGRRTGRSTDAPRPPC
jgi:hypothetical protein